MNFLDFGVITMFVLFISLVIYTMYSYRKIDQKTKNFTEKSQLQNGVLVHEINKNLEAMSKEMGYRLNKNVKEEEAKKAYDLLVVFDDGFTLKYEDVTKHNIEYTSQDQRDRMLYIYKDNDKHDISIDYEDVRVVEKRKIENRKDK